MNAPASRPKLSTQKAPFVQRMTPTADAIKDLTHEIDRAANAMSIAMKEGHAATAGMLADHMFHQISQLKRLCEIVHRHCAEEIGRNHQ